jgi:hypothetical protein
MWRSPMTRGQVRHRGADRGRAGFQGLEGVDLARDVTCAQSYRWDEMRWAWPEGYVRRPEGPAPRVVALDYGAKRNILRCLASAGCDVTVMPAETTADEVLAQNPDGVPVERSGRSGGDRGICRSDDPRHPRHRHSGLRHLPRPPDACARAGGQDGQDEPRPPRREPSGEGSGDRQGRDHLDEPRLHRRQPDPARGSHRNPCLASSTGRIAGYG